jgi:hypothetical protein
MKTLLILFAIVAISSVGVVALAQQDTENPLDDSAQTEEPAAEPAPEPEPEPAPEAGAPVSSGDIEEAPPPVQVSEEKRPPTVLLGLGAGAYIPTSDLGVSFLVGLDLAYQLPWLHGKLGVGGGMAYSQPTTSGTIEDSRVPGGQADYDSTMRELVLDLQLTYRIFCWDSIWSPHAGIGPVFYLLQHKVNSLEHEQDETSTQVGVLLTLGADYYLWHGALVGEVRIPFAMVDQKTTGDSNVGAVSIVVGYRFRF